MVKTAVLGAALALVCSSALANHRCVGADGRVTYQDAACPASATDARQVKLAENTVDGQRPVWRPSGARSAATMDEAVRLTCADQWPGNARMRAHCERRQVEAFAETQRALTATPEVAARIRLQCEQAYPNDYRMRAACLRVEERRSLVAGAR